MKYYVMFARQNHLASRLVQWFTRGKPDHVAVGVGEVVYEAAPGHGVRSVGVKSWMEQYPGAVIYTVEAGAEVVRFLREQIGKPYDWRGLIGFLARTRTERGKAWFCSELVVAAFHAGRIDLLRGDPDKISPAVLEMSPLLTPLFDHIGVPQL